MVRRGCCRDRDIGVERRHQRDVDRDDNRRSRRHGGEVLPEPVHLGGIDAALIGAVGGDPDGVQYEEVMALVIERVVGPAEAVAEELLP
jgi:hypothetical protein